MGTNTRTIALIVTTNGVHDRHSPIARAICPANIKGSSRIVLGASTGTGIARRAHGNIALVQLKRTGSHLARRLIRHRGIAVERLLLNAEHAMLNLVAVRHRTAAQHRRGTRDIGNRRGDHARCQRFSRRNRNATNACTLDDIACELFIVRGNLLK